MQSVFMDGHMRRMPRAAVILPILAVLSLWANAAFAHGVTAGDAGYIQEIWGVNLIPFGYLGAKHMITGYDHILFLFGVVFFLYRMKDVGIYVSIFAIGHSSTMLAGVWFGWGVNAYNMRLILQLKRDGTPATDKYRRHLGRLLLDGQDAATLMINADLAEPYTGGTRRSWCP